MVVGQLVDGTRVHLTPNAVELQLSAYGVAEIRALVSELQAPVTYYDKRGQGEAEPETEWLRCSGAGKQPLSN